MCCSNGTAPDRIAVELSGITAGTLTSCCPDFNGVYILERVPTDGPGGCAWRLEFPDDCEPGFVATLDLTLICNLDGSYTTATLTLSYPVLAASDKMEWVHSQPFMFPEEQDTTETCFNCWTLFGITGRLETCSNYDFSGNASSFAVISEENGECTADETSGCCVELGLDLETVTAEFDIDATACMGACGDTTPSYVLTFNAGVVETCDPFQDDDGNITGDGSFSAACKWVYEEVDGLACALYGWIILEMVCTEHTAAFALHVVSSCGGVGPPSTHLVYEKTVAKSGLGSGSSIVLALTTHENHEGGCPGVIAGAFATITFS